MVSLEQECTHSSVQHLWPKQLISGTDNKELAFQETELQVLFEAICSFSPPLQTVHLGYSPLINDCQSCHQVLSHLDGYQAPGLRATHESDPSLHPKPRPLTELNQRLLPSQSAFTSPHHDTKPSYRRQGTFAPTDENLSSPTSELTLVRPRNTHVVASRASQKPFPNYHSIYSLRRTRKKRSRYLQQNQSKSLQTIPENQEWNLPDEHSKRIFRCAMLETPEPRSVFENDSDSEGESEEI